MKKLIAFFDSFMDVVLLAVVFSIAAIVAGITFPENFPDSIEGGAFSVIFVGLLNVGLAYVAQTLKSRSKSIREGKPTLYAWIFVLFILAATFASVYGLPVLLLPVAGLSQVVVVIEGAITAFAMYALYKQS